MGDASFHEGFSLAGKAVALVEALGVYLRIEDALGVAARPGRRDQGLQHRPAHALAGMSAVALAGSLVVFARSPELRALD